MIPKKAIIAEDEPAILNSLRKLLSKYWPELEVCGTAHDGISALNMMETMRPDFAFLDIRMPGLTGIEVASRLTFPCSIVFITAYERYAIDAFEKGAIDYLLKPVTDARLVKTVERLKLRIDHSDHGDDGNHGNHNGTQIRELLSALLAAAHGGGERLKWLNVRHKDAVRLIPVDAVIYFRATDKYTTVRTADDEYLIGKTIRELAEHLPSDTFRQVHRAVIVNLCAIDRVVRSLTGRYELHLKEIPDTLQVSRAYSPLFHQM